MTAPQRVFGSLWSKEELGYIVKRKKEGASDKEIGFEMGATRKAIQDTRRKHKIKERKTVKWTKELDSEIVDLRASGCTWEEIGETLGGFTSTQCASRYQRLVAAGKVEDIASDAAVLRDIRAPTPEDARRAMDAEMLRAENAGRMKSYVRRTIDSARNPPRNWSPGDPVTW